MDVTRWALVVTAVLFVTIVASGGVVADDPVTLTVSVTDRAGDPVGGATVEATWETDAGDTGSASGTTASNGRVLLDVPEGAAVELDVEDDRYVRNRPLRIANASQTDVALGVARSGTATVTVVDGENRSQAGASVTVREDGRTVDRGETGADGTYETARLERDTYEVFVVKPGYVEVEQRVTAGPNGSVTVAIERGTTTLRVRALDDHFDPPVAIENGSVEASSSVYDGEVTLTDGTASFTVPVNALYTVEVIKEGYDPSTERVRVREESVTANATAQRTPALSVAPANERVLVGETTRVTVRNAYDERVAGATVEVDGEAAGETDDRGEVDVPISSAGNRTIVARDGSVTSDPVTVEGVDSAAEADGNESDGGNGSDGDGNGTDEGGDTGTTDDSNPGFGVVAAALALLAVAAASRVSGR